MKILLPNGQKSVLDESISLDEKNNVVLKLTEEWDEAITEGWENTTIMYFLDTLANYLVWHKDDVEDEEGQLKKDTTEDKEVMSRNKTNRLYRGRKDISFSSLSDKDQEILFGERGTEQ